MSLQYLLGLGLALLLIPIVEFTLAVLPDIGWHFMTIFYVTIFVLQIAFYYLTTNFKLGWTTLSFILNFIVWALELIIFEKAFHDSLIYTGENWKNSVFIIGGLLWVTNKILLDQLFSLNESIFKQTSKIKV